MIDQFTHRFVVADDYPVELPFAAQDLFERERVSRSWNAVEIVKGAHECSDTGIDCSLERREVDFTKCPFRHLRSVVIAPAFRCSIRYPVLGAGDDPAGLAVIVSLKSKHASPRYSRTKIRVFAGAFDDSPPPRISGYIDHGSECPAHTGGGRLGSGNARCASHP